MSLSSRLGIGFMRVLAPLPLPLVRGFSRILGRLLHTIAVPRRRVVDRNLAICFPEKSEAERRAIARETFVFVAQSWLDRSWLWHAPEKVVASVAPFHCTCEAVVKLDPMAVIVNEALPGVVEAGSSE